MAELDTRQLPRQPEESPLSRPIPLTSSPTPLDSTTEQARRVPRNPAPQPPRLAQDGLARVDDVWPLIQERLHRAAARYLRKERINHTLQPTALVNEAYLKLRNHSGFPEAERDRFFLVAVEAMWRILVDHAKQRLRSKRGGEHRTVRLETNVPIVTDGPSFDILALAEALERLEAIRPRQSKLLKLHHFGELSVRESADILEISKRTADREWDMAKAWLRRILTK